MFENLRQAFREAVSNFKDELDRDDVPETVDRLLRGMVEEVTDAKAYVRRLESEITQTHRMVEREAEAAATARRREAMAQKIQDGETARVASEYAAKHDRSHEVLTAKVTALEEELAVRTAEIEDMMVKLKAARADRERLSATASRAGARSSINEADDLFAEMDRMAEKIQDTEAEAASAEAVGGEWSTRARPRSDPDLDVRFRELEREAAGEPSVEDKLEELKRRMGKD